MNCPNCGAAHTGSGAFCVSCGARLTPPTSVSVLTQEPAQAPTVAVPASAPTPYQPAPVQPATFAPTPVRAPTQAAAVQRGNGIAIIRHISAGSVFKVIFVIYALLLAIFGCFAVVLPGLLGSSLLGGMMDDRYGLGAIGAGIIGTLISYVVLVVGGSLVPAIVIALSALIYNLVAGWVGGIQVTLQE